MMRTCYTKGKGDTAEEMEYQDHTVEEAAQRARRLIHQSIAEYETDHVPRKVAVFIGFIPGRTVTSWPKKPSDLAVSAGLDLVSLAGIMDLALRSLHHPSIAEVEFTTDHGGNVLWVTDHNGKRFKISISQE